LAFRGLLPGFGLGLSLALGVKGLGGVFSIFRRTSSSLGGFGMAGPKVKQEFKPAMKCIFEDAGKTTATHVFPDCLNNHIELPGNRFQDTRYAVGKDQSDEREFNIKQGGMFTQAPFIACKTCNGGWMRYFEDEILKFILPILTTHDRVVLNHKQMKLLAGWTALITITNEFINRNTPPVIPVKDRLYLKEKG
jgi:hypothetical protein